MEEAIAQKKIELKLELASYRGDDPLKLMFEYLVWLDESYGRENCQQEFNHALEETLKKFYLETKYYEDERFVKLVIFYSELQNNPGEILTTIYKKGIGVKSSQFYESWANEYCKMGNFNEADKIFNLGFSNNASPKTSLENFYKQFLQTIGKNYLCGQLVDNNEKICSKCSQKIEEKEVDERQEVKHWEINPLDMKNKDDFECPVNHPDPEDPKKQSMYPKNLVYVDGKEYSLEELKSIIFLKRINELEKQIEAANEISAKKIKKADESSNCDAKKDRSASIQRSTCYGDITKEAMDVIQEMWNSPGLVVVDKFKESTHKKALDSNNTPVRPDTKKSVPFTIYTEDSMAENHQPYNNAASVTKQTAVPKPNLLSERKAEPVLSVERTMTARQLPFQPTYANNGLAQKMSLATIDNKPSIPVDDEDTCNTKAFAFLLPSSTPVQLKKSQNQPQNHNGSYLEEAEEKNEKVDTKQELSVIMEASKERYSSSSSNGSSNPRTGINKEVMRPLQFESVDNPFSRDLNEWFLSQMNFPLPYQTENYHKSVANIPAMTKTIVLDGEVHTIINEIGKGAYARIMRGKLNNKDYALKVEKPACNWEYYIAKETQRRVDPRMKRSFVDIEGAFIFKNGSVLRMEWARYGTLLSLVSEYRQKTGKFFTRAVTLHFAMEMVDIIYTLHKAKIIHGDIKPDNFVLKHLPDQNETETCIQLIDFGRSIDMTLFPEGTQFKHVVNTDGFQCNEMKENKPWTYQTDLYGLAGSLYCLLVGNYMKVVKKYDEWKLLQLLPRNVKREVWDPIFITLLNVKSPYNLNDLLEIKSVLQREMNSISNPNLLTMEFQQLQNVVNGF